MRKVQVFELFLYGTSKPYVLSYSEYDKKLIKRCVEECRYWNTQSLVKQAQGY